MLAGKVVLITGATGALGRQLVSAFRETRATLALVVRSASDVYEYSRLFDRMPDAATAAVVESCDLRYEDEVVRLVHRVVARLGRIDVLVNAATVVGPRYSLTDYPAEPWRYVIDTNVSGPYLLCREVIPWMVRQRQGSIINVTACPVESGRLDLGAFAVSNHSVLGLTEQLAAELDGSGVRVNSVELAIPAAEGDAGPKDPAWTRAFVWLASDASLDRTGQRIVAADFSKEN